MIFANSASQGNSMIAPLSRRDLLASVTAAALAPAFIAPSSAKTPLESTTIQGTEAAKLNALMDTFFEENLEENPESATLLGLDKDANAALKRRLRDESIAGIERAKALNAS